MKSVMLAAAAAAALLCAACGSTAPRSQQPQFQEWQGGGPPLIFVAEPGENEHAFDRLAPRFADRFHPIALGPASVDQLREFVRARQIASAHFVGVGLAAATIIELARVDRDKVESIVLIDPVDASKPVDFRAIRKPVLGLFAAGQPGESSDLANRTAEALAQQAPQGVVMFIRGPHRLHAERQEEVVREMNAFFNAGMQQQP